MSGVAHTPGPWEVDGPDMFGDYNIVLANRESDSRAIAAVVSNLRDPAEVAANARLNAAAPELLAELEGALSDLWENCHSHQDRPSFERDYARAFAVIAKARGEA